MFKKKIGAGILAIVTAIAAMNISVLAETKKETATGTYDGRLWTGTTSYVTGTKKYTMYLTCDWEDQMFTEYRVKGVPVGTTNVLSQ